MIQRHTTFFVNKIEPIELCGMHKIWQLDLSGAFEKPFETQPTEGEHDFNTCEGCQETLRELIRRLTEKFEGNKDRQGFPFCCPYHSELVKIREFNRADFVGIPEMVAKKIIYTNSHIKNHHQSKTYYKDITDYIDYTVESFGQMPGAAEPLFLSDYFFYITYLVEQNTDITEERRSKLLEFLKVYQTPSKNPKTDLTVLLVTYQKWLKIFPFDLNSYFGSLRQYFEKQIPILNDNPEINAYTGVAKAKMHTKSSLIEALINLTDSILTQINGVTLYEKGLITDANKIKMELAISSRKLKLSKGYKNNSPDEGQRYRKILKEWFNDEKKFFDEITPLLKALPPKQPEAKTEQEQESQNDFTLSTIDDWLFEFKEKMIKKDYETLVSALIQYFHTGKFPTLTKAIQINGRPNKKLFGWALNRIFEATGRGIEKELLVFAKNNISLFADVQFDETNILKSNLYKYFTTQTK